MARGRPRKVAPSSATAVDGGAQDVAAVAETAPASDVPATVDAVEVSTAGADAPVDSGDVLKPGADSDAGAEDDAPGSGHDREMDSAPEVLTAEEPRPEAPKSIARITNRTGLLLALSDGSAITPFGEVEIPLQDGKQRDALANEVTKLTAENYLSASDLELTVTGKTKDQS